MTQRELSGSRKVLLFVGDSDIARWPSELLPSRGHDVDEMPPPIASGHSGATLQEIVPHLKAALESLDVIPDAIVLVACAGENDIGNGFSRDDTLSAFDELLRLFFGDAAANGTFCRRLIFLGPKLEPWLNDDPSSRKQYVKLSRAFQRACAKHERADDILFVDCLTMFCGDSANVPGATLGGKAKADPKYFSNDQLHLSQEGYRIWKQVVENHLSDLSED